MAGEEELASAATGALWAREVERARVEAPALGHEVAEPCANCGTMRVGVYCHVCGQFGHVHRNLHTLVHDIAHGVFHFEGKIWNTLPLLIRRPGQLTRRYIDGERAKFVSPMALFLFSVFLMFAVVNGLAGKSHSDVGQVVRAGSDLAQARTELATLEAQRARASSSEVRAALDERIGTVKRAVAALDTTIREGATASADKVATKREARLEDFEPNTGWAWLDEAARHATANPELLVYKMKSNAYKFSWALIPISLPFIWLLFAWRRDVGLYDHAIFAIYSLAFMSLGVVVLMLFGRVGVAGWVLWTAAAIVPPIHMYKQLKGTYRLGRFGAAWRTFALLLIISITTSLFLSFLFYLGSE
jgi:hypothetical protein